MFDRYLGLTGECLATSKIVERGRVAARFEGAPPPFNHADVVAGFVGGIELGPDLPATGLIRLPDDAADREHDCLRLLRVGGAVHQRLDEHQRSLRCVNGVSVDLESSVAAKHDVELFTALVLLVFGHQPITHVCSCPSVRPESGDPEVVTHRTHMRVLPVVDVLQLVDTRHLISHSSLQSI